MQILAQTSSCPKSSTGTTLFDLIEAIGEELPPGEDKRVAEMVMHLFDTGQIKFISNTDTKS